MQYAFYLDSSSCSGCKACQAACKDRNGLEAGRVWRRVYEVSGGGWSRAGEAWVSSVFAYNLSLSCNHCALPACQDACPAGAISRRPDGIVLIDETKCLGCGYCAWACPYGAPQYDARAGRMTKCNFCVEDIVAGRPPACVAACPLRVLEYGDRLELQRRHAESRQVYPLPDPAYTQPGLVLTPHQAAGAAQAGPARVANREEVHPQERSSEAKKETPLVAFTLLAQMAAGLILALAFLQASPVIAAAGLGSLALDRIFLAAGALAGLSMLISLLHLGNPWQAYRAVTNLRTSWLSREIFFSACLVGGWIALAGLRGFPAVPAWVQRLGIICLALIGLGLVYSMARLYRLRAVAAWNTWA
ncbi:MAG TPA: DMSO/selenate family reductase complex B subunit, partial [Anaerolineales bacterium]